jgi:hypothetical protein
MNEEHYWTFPLLKYPLVAPFSKEVWRLAPLCLLWCIWRERNARLFEDVETPMVELRKRLLNTLYSWIAPHHSLSVFTFVDFLNLLSVRPV